MATNDNATKTIDGEKPKKKRTPDALIKRAEIDSDWFRRQLEVVGRTQNALGAHLGLPGSQASRMISGLRKMKLDEVPKIARFLSVPVEDVLKHAGLTVGAHDFKPMVAETVIDDEGRVTTAKEPFQLPPILAERAAAMAPFDQQNTIATSLIRAPKGLLSLLDDNVVVHEAFSSPPQKMGTMSLARLRDGVTVLAREITDVRKTGEATIIRASDMKPVNVNIESIKKVITVLQ